jgi:DNA topoisomerase-1
MGRTEDHNGLIPPPKNTRKGKLVIVESPAKARTVGRFLGKDYTVKASVGHVRDLLKSQLSVDVENNFTPKYRVPKEKTQVVKEIKALAKTAEEIYLATDPDREGEAIAWHLLESAEINPKITHRVVFHEITEPAVAEAFSHPREINMDLVDAQQARRVLDRLVGYNLSPLLWRKVRSRLSAGRVQSVALRLVVEREREIDAFIPEEYWSIAAEFQPEGLRETFLAKLARIDGEEPILKNEDDVKPVVANLQASSYSITKIKRGERRRKPSAPFTTSTLQQEASRRLGYTARRTMTLAQQLYEGIDLGGGSVGLITYMRTDSTNVAELSQQEAREFILKLYGADFMPSEPPRYQTKARGAQEAHEAIRPTSVARQPQAIKEFLNRDQFRLYQLIWQRFLASQMEAAVYDTLSVEITGTGTGQEYLLRASGSSIKFPGFLIVYEEVRDEDQPPSEEEDNIRIPAQIAEGQKQRLVQVLPEQHFTQPPPRYTEATLVRTLEENGIGRPSTYAPILGTIQQRGYVVRDGKRLIPTETGVLVNDLITQHFPNIVDLEFTAHMEENLDRIASGETSWMEPIREFYLPFADQVQRADTAIPEMKTGPEPIGRVCPDCGHELVIRWGRYGKFISCSNFPDCRHTEAWLEKIGVKCPKDGGEIVERKTRKGRAFYGCANYPNCDFTSWKQPLPTPCPACQGLLVIAKKDQAQCLQCEEIYSLDSVTAEETA